MWDQKLLLWWPLFWSQFLLSSWQHGAATRTAMLDAARRRPLPERTLRTPLLCLHVGMLKPTPRPRPRERKPGAWLKSV